MYNFPSTPVLCWTKWWESNNIERVNHLAFAGGNGMPQFKTLLKGV